MIQLLFREGGRGASKWTSRPHHQSLFRKEKFHVMVSVIMCNSLYLFNFLYIMKTLFSYSWFFCGSLYLSIVKCPISKTQPICTEIRIQLDLSCDWQKNLPVLAYMQTIAGGTSPLAKYLFLRQFYMPSDECITMKFWWYCSVNHCRRCFHTSENEVNSHRNIDLKYRFFRMQVDAFSPILLTMIE